MVAYGLSGSPVVVIRMEEVQPRNKEPDPNKHALGVGSGKAHQGSRIQYDILGSRRILDVQEMYIS
jgi:hypothetical protein